MIQQSITKAWPKPGAERAEKNIREELVQAVRIHWGCPADGCSGEMISTGTSQLSHPARHWHRCNTCAVMALSTTHYPVIEFRSITVGTGK